MEIKRDKYLEQLDRNKHNHLVKIVTGVRRAGKSYLLFTLFKNKLIKEGIPSNHIIEIAFDNFAYREYRNAEKLYNYVKQQITDDKMYYILLDEVQLLDNFVDVLNGFLYIPNVDIYVTGSNAKFLSSDIVTEFRGRGIQIHVHTLSFKEFISVYKEDKHAAWQEYMKYGGLPLVVLTPSEEDKINILKNLLKETYLSDIINRNRIKNDSELEDLFYILASNIGTLTNPQKLSNTFKSEKHIDIKPDTIKKYINYFIDSFLIEKALRYDVKGKKYIDTPHKYYFVDMGLRNALLNFRQIEPTHIMENILFNELRIRNYNVDVGQVIYYTKDKEGKTQRITLEIDFICNKGDEKLYIQSAYSMPDKEKEEQEIRSLNQIRESFEKIVITADNIPPHKNENGITITNIYKYLLE